MAVSLESATVARAPKKAPRGDGTSQAAVSYMPNEQEYKERQDYNLRDPNRVSKLPEGFPTQVTSNPTEWEGEDMLQQVQNWRVELDADDLEDAERALRGFQAKGLHPSKITQETFQLQPQLTKKLANASTELHEGRGFIVFRGIQPEKYTAEENVFLFSGLMSHVGSTRGYHTPESNDVIGHVHDLTQYYPQGEVYSPTSTRTKMPFHTDNADILALYVLNAGVQGGTFKIASTARVYNDIAPKRPDLIDALSKDYLFDCYIDNYKPYSRPLLFLHEGKLILQCFRRPFTGFSSLRRRAGLPGLTSTQAEALDAIHFTAEKHCIPLQFQNGDIILLHNFSVLHARDETDLDTVNNEAHSSQKKRHLLKMFLRDEKRAWPLPEPFKRDWEILYGLRGKAIEEREEAFRITPQTQGKLPTGWVQNG